MKASLRVTVISIGELFGGVERHLLGLAEYLSSRVDHLQVILFHDRTLARELRDRGIEPTIIHFRFPFDPRQVFRLRAVLTASPTDVIHVHGYKATVLTSLCGHSCGIVTVKTEHGMIEPLQDRMIDALKARLYSGLDLWATRRSCATVCYVTNDLHKHLMNQHGGIRQHVVYNGIEPLSPERYTRPTEFDTGHYHIVIAGRVDVVKGIAHAVKAIAHPSTPKAVRLNIIGDGPLTDYLKALSDKLGVASQVRFLGFKSDVYRYLAHADTLLLPSLHEGLPYILLEAMSLGLPIIASRVGGLAEILEHGRTALLVPPENPDAIADAIATLHANPEVARALGNAAALEQRQHFDLAAMGARYMEIYAEAASAAGAHV
ncbi:MAG: glycosyltransferase family 4 protein [Pseudomonadota bacterium]